MQQHPTLSTQRRWESKVEDSSGNVMTYNGKVNLDIEILGHRYEGVQAFVVPATEYRRNTPLLIGTAVIRALQIDYESQSGKEYLDEVLSESPVWYTAIVHYNQNVYGGTSGFVGSARYSGRRPRVIPPNGCEVDISVRVPKAPGEVPYVGLLERSSTQSGPGNLLVANTVIIVSHQHAKLRVLNPTDQPLTIRRNTRLADLYVVDIVNEGPIAGSGLMERKQRIRKIKLKPVMIKRSNM